MSSNYENIGKTVTADFTTNYDAETKTLLKTSGMFVNAPSNVALKENCIRMLKEATRIVRLNI